MIKNALKNLNRSIMPKQLLYGPKWLVLGVNNLCNLHCKMCDVGTNSKETNFSENLIGSKPVNMPIELFEEITVQASKYYPNTRIGYAFTEPLIYKYLEESLELTQKYKIHTSITTNALKLNEKATQIVESGVKDIFISLDGPEAIHNNIRGNRHSFQKAIEGIEALLGHSSPPLISIFCVVTEWNVGFLKEFADYFRHYPLKQMGFMHANFTTHQMAQYHNDIYGACYPATHSNVEEVSIENLDMKRLWSEIKLIKQSEYAFPIIFSPDLPNENALELYYKQPQQFIGSMCKDAFSNMMIKSDGVVIPAHGRCYNLEVGNLNNMNLNEIWNSTVFGDFRKELNHAGGLLPACSRCCSAFSQPE